jgi:hypothetical protein
MASTYNLNATMWIVVFSIKAILIARYIYTNFEARNSTVAKHNAKQKQLEEAATATITQSNADASSNSEIEDTEFTNRKFIFVGVSILLFAGAGYYFAQSQPAERLADELGSDALFTSGTPTEIPLNSEDEQGEIIFPVTDASKYKTHTNIEISDPLGAVLTTEASMELQNVLLETNDAFTPMDDENTDSVDTASTPGALIIAGEDNKTHEDPLGASLASSATELEGLKNSMQALESLAEPLLEMSKKSKMIMNSQSQKINKLTQDITELESSLQGKTIESDARKFAASQQSMENEYMADANVAPQAINNSEIVLTTLILDILEAYPRGSLNVERLTTAEFVASTMNASPSLLKALEQLKTVSDNGVVTVAALLNDVQTLKATKRYASDGLLNASEADSAVKSFVKRHTAKWINVRKVENAKVTAALNTELSTISSHLLSGQPKKALARLITALNTNKDLETLKTNNQLVELQTDLIKSVVQADALRTLKQAYQQNLIGGVL